MNKKQLDKKMEKKWKRSKPFYRFFFGDYLKVKDTAPKITTTYEE